MASKLALEKVAQASRGPLDKTAQEYDWKEPLNLDAPLMEAFADMLDPYIDALRWCGGSDDFAPGGVAHEGWERICSPLL